MTSKKVRIPMAEIMEWQMQKVAGTSTQLLDEHNLINIDGTGLDPEDIKCLCDEIKERVRKLKRK